MASDVPDVELTDTEVAEVLSGRVIPIGAFFDSSTASAAGRAGDNSADVAGATFLADISRILATWAADRYLGITSASGIGIALAACGAAWFSAGTRADIIRGVVALWAGYLVLRGGKWLAAQADQAAEQPLTQADADVIAGSGTSTIVAAGAAGAREASADGRGRTSRLGNLSAELRRTGPVGWLAALGGAVAECGVYAGLRPAPRPNGGPASGHSRPPWSASSRCAT